MATDARQNFLDTLDSDQDIDLGDEVTTSGITIEDDAGERCITAVIAQFEEEGDPVRAAFLEAMRATVLEARNTAMLARAACKVLAEKRQRRQRHGSHPR